MPNPVGTPGNLVAAHPGNTNGLAHGAYSVRREVHPRAAEIADALLAAAPHTVPLDRLAAEEIGALVVLLDRIDAALADGKVENRNGQVRSLIDLRGRMSSRLERWLREFGLTPASRAEWAARMAQGGLADEIARRRAAIEGSAA